MEIFAMQGIWGKRSISKKNATRARWLLWSTNFTLLRPEDGTSPYQLQPFVKRENKEMSR